MSVTGITSIIYEL